MVVGPIDAISERRARVLARAIQMDVNHLAQGSERKLASFKLTKLHSLTSEWAVLRWLLPLAFLHGMLYLALEPPWQHYDEPTHFEYAYLIAATGKVPALDSGDPQFRREVADSMYRFRFYAPGVQPDLLVPEGPGLGLDQRVHPPLYYALVALPIRATRFLSVEQQLYTARLVGVLLYTLVVAAAYRVACVASPDQPLVHLVFPLTVACVPAFTSMMSAVNNDVLVNFAGAALLLGALYLVRDGPRPFSLALALLGLFVGLATKRTATVLIVPVLLAFFWALYRHPMRWLRFLLGGLLLSVVLVFVSLHIDLAGSTLVARLRDWFVRLDQSYLRLYLEPTLRSLTDWERSSEIYPALISLSFTTFWCYFGWGHVGMGAFWERALFVLNALSLAGLAVQGLRVRRELPLWQKRCIWLFFWTLTAAWLSLIVRVHPLPPSGVPFYYPRGRYIHLALIPTIWLMLIGLQGLVARRWQRAIVLVLLIFLVVLDMAAWMITIPGAFYQ